MRLASLNEGGPDGTLLVVDGATGRAVRATGIAQTLQAALDEWSRVEPQLRALAGVLARGHLENAFVPEPSQLMAVLPRPYNFLDGSAYPHHMSVIREARGASMPADFFDKPLMYQGMAARMLNPLEPIRLLEDTAYGVDFEAEVAVLTDTIPLGTAKAQAAKHIRLYVLLNDISLRTLVPPELARGFGFMQSKPASTLGPIAVTPDELELAGPGMPPRGDFHCYVGDTVIGTLNPAEDGVFDYADLIAHAALTRELPAGTLIGAGAIANADRERGCGCIAERRAREQLTTGKASTDYLRFGERVRLEMFDKAGRSVFGAIDQSLERAGVVR